MIGNTRVITMNPRTSPLFGVDRLIDSIGSDTFGASLTDLLMDCSGADFCSVFRIDECKANTLAACTTTPRTDMVRDHANRYAGGMHWRHDPALLASTQPAATRRSVMVWIDATQVDDIVLRRDFYQPAGIGERLAISARRNDALYVVSLLRSIDRGRFPDTAITRLSDLCDTTMSLLVSHAERRKTATAEHALSNVQAIEARILGAKAAPQPWTLTNRERQVCARILYGMTALGIALDLGVSECSIDTYRKRAYHRLGIATRHELLRLYLSLDDGASSLH